LVECIVLEGLDTFQEAGVDEKNPMKSSANVVQKKCMVCNPMNQTSWQELESSKILSKSFESKKPLQPL
jgi:hypothetical protein